MTDEEAGSAEQDMKRPKYAAMTMQKQCDAGLNPFAAQLMAEAHADKPERFGDETGMVVARAHNGTDVICWSARGARRWNSSRIGRYERADPLRPSTLRPNFSGCWK